MTDNQPPSEDDPDLSCADCHNPDCPNAPLSRMKLRFQVDEEGDEYVHVGDLGRGLQTLIEMQSVFNATTLAAMELSGDPNFKMSTMNCRSIEMGMETLMANISHVIGNPQYHMVAPKADELPDTVPAEWGEGNDAGSGRDPIQ